MDIVEAEDGQEQDLFEIERGAPQPLALRIRRGVRKDLVLSLAEDGSLAWRRPDMRHPSLESSRTSPPSQFVTAESLQAHEMAVLWDQVVVAGRESEVLEAMRILEEDLDSIYFLTGDTTRRTGGSPGIVLGFGPGAPRVPIGSYGDGMRRLLALSLALVHTGGGFLLIDEIDTGLHWTVMEEMWKLVVEGGRQVLHSGLCDDPQPRLHHRVGLAAQGPARLGGQRLNSEGRTGSRAKCGLRLR